MSSSCAARWYQYFHLLLASIFENECDPFYWLETVYEYETLAVLINWACFSFSTVHNTLHYLDTSLLKSFLRQVGISFLYEIFTYISCGIQFFFFTYGKKCNQIRRLWIGIRMARWVYLAGKRNAVSTKRAQMESKHGLNCTSGVDSLLIKRVPDGVLTEGK